MRATTILPLRVDEEAQIAARFFQRLFEAIRAADSSFDIAATLRNHGVTRQAIRDRSPLARFERFYAVLQSVHATGRIPGIALRYGMRLSLEDYGWLGYAMVSSVNLMQAWDLSLKYAALIGDRSSVSRHFEPGRAILVADQPWDTPARLQCAIEDYFATTWRQMSLLQPKIGVDGLIRLDLKFPRPDYARLYEETFRCPVRFGQPRNALIFPDRWLDVPFDTANLAIEELCEQQCQLMIDRLSKQEPIVDRIRRLFLRNPHLEIPTLEVTAKHFSMSPRTLRRRISEAGTTYKAIVNDVRLSVAKAYLQQTELTAQEIGYLAGYSHAPSFYRAFKSRFGTTPDECRSADAASEA